MTPLKFEKLWEKEEEKNLIYIFLQHEKCADLYINQLLVILSRIRLKSKITTHISILILGMLNYSTILEMFVMVMTKLHVLVEIWPIDIL